MEHARNIWEHHTVRLRSIRHQTRLQTGQVRTPPTMNAGRKDQHGARTTARANGRVLRDSHEETCARQYCGHPPQRIRIRSSRLSFSSLELIRRRGKRLQGGQSARVAIFQKHGDHGPAKRSHDTQQSP